jgi:hypothetical protein
MAKSPTKLPGAPNPGPASAPPMREQGVSGTPIFGGFIRQPERNAKLVGQNRYRFAADILTNISIVAAGVRYFLNLVSKPKWKVVPADDSAEAKAVAEFVEECLFGMATAWNRVVRRMGMFRYHGFGIHEWTAIRRDDGRIGLKDIESRPQFTIWRWAVDAAGNIEGVWQRSPQTGQEIWLPRSKIVYLVDDMMTDSPEGLGWFRGLADPAERLKRYLEIETMGYERNLAGVPLGRVPYAAINAAVAAMTITAAEAKDMVAAMEQFVELQAKNEATSIILDSSPYESVTDSGTNISQVYKWSVELLKGDISGMPELINSIDREMHQCARIMGIENILLGANGKGSLALAKNESENLYLVINSTVQDIAEAADRDAIGPIIDLNGIDQKLRPTLSAEDVAFKDIVEMSSYLMNMASAGAVLQPDDPAIDELRALAGLSNQPKIDPAMMAAMQGAGTGPGGRGDPNKPAPDNAASEGGAAA